MKLNNVNGINGVDSTKNNNQISDSKRDNEYIGEKVTMDTPNPAEVLGRSMVTAKKSAEPSVISSDHIENSRVDAEEIPSKKQSISRSYLGKTKLYIKNISHRVAKTFAPGLESQMSDEEISEAKRLIEELKQELLNSPDSFSNCTNDEKEKLELIENFFNKKTKYQYYQNQKSLIGRVLDFFGPAEDDEKNLSMITLIHVLGKDAAKILLNKGILVAEVELTRFNELSKSKLSFLKSYLDESTVEHKPLNPQQKLELFDLFEYYSSSSGVSSIKRFKENMTDGKVDIAKLRKNFVENFNLSNNVLDIVQKLVDEKAGVYDFNKLFSFLLTLKSIQYGGGFNWHTQDAVREILTDKEEVFKCVDNVTSLGEHLSKKSEKYVNGEHSESESIGIAELFYGQYRDSLFLVEYLLGKEAVDVLLRKRLNFVEEYFPKFLFQSNFNKDELLLIKGLANSTDVDGKPILPSQKIEFPQLVDAYRKCNLSFEKMQKMIDSGKVDVMQLKVDMFKKVLSKAGLSEDEISQIPNDKLVSWNIDYVHKLFGVTKNQGYRDIIRAANLEDFESYIHDTSNAYGTSNAKTQKMFSEMNMNYQNWIHPSKEHELEFISKDKNHEQLLGITDKIAKEMNVLMQTPAKGHIKKNFPDCIKDDTFVIPEKYSTSKAELSKFVKLLIDDEHSKMNAVWNRAKGNLKSDNPDKVLSAQNTMTILYHLNQSAEAVENITVSPQNMQLNWKIKMWDRIPQKDLFQGNYSQCCIGVGAINGSAMPHYLMDTAFNMIEIRDNDTDETIGNALCYFVKTEDGKPAFLIDNVEIANRFIPSGKVGKDLRNSIVKYAESVIKDVTGSSDVPILMGDSFNDIPVLGLPLSREKISLLGVIDDDSIYLDAYNGWTSKENLKAKHSLFRLK